MTNGADSDMDAVVAAVADGDITFGEAGTAELPPVPDGEPKVVCSFRLPVEAYQRLREVAAQRGVKPTALIRDWVMAGLAATDEDRTISVADLLRVVAALPQPPPPHRDAA
jgi:predicted DNA-binding protein